LKDAKMQLTEEHADLVQVSLKAPYVSARFSNLGGFSKGAILICISLDAKDTWINKILENSRYAHFSIEYDGTIENFTSSKCSHMRKSKYKTVEEAILKIQKWIDKNV
jgi:hypothetical protein